MSINLKHSYPIILLILCIFLSGCSEAIFPTDGVLDKEKNNQFYEDASQNGYYKWMEDVGTHGYASAEEIYLKKNGIWYKYGKENREFWMSWKSEDSSIINPDTINDWIICKNNYPDGLLRPTLRFEFIGSVPNNKSDDIIKTIPNNNKPTNNNQIDKDDPKDFIPLFDTLWDINSATEDTQSKRFDIYVDSETNKYQIFYSADSEAPEIVFQSVNGDTYIAGEDYTDKTNNFYIKTIKNTVCVPPYTNLKFDTIYISGAPDPGTWSMQVTIPPTTKNPLQELIITQNTPDLYWKTLEVSYQSRPIDLFAWYLGPKYRNEYTDSSSISLEITKIIAEPNPPGPTY